MSPPATAGPRWSPARVAVAGGLALALLIALGVLARVPLAGSHPDRSALRLTWRLRGEEVVECRKPTKAELQGLPAHMRNPDACVGVVPTFLLAVRVDGEERIRRRVEPSGARGDRPLYIYEELVLEPGTHDLEVRFSPDTSSAGAAVARPSAALHLTTSVDLAPGQVLLVTRDGTGDLEVRAPRR